MEPRSVARVDGLMVANLLVGRLANNPHLLDAARQRFSRSPPRVVSPTFSTLSNSPNAPPSLKPGQRTESEVWADRLASTVYNQLEFEEEVEMKKIEAHSGTLEKRRQLFDVNVEALARAAVEKSWRSQGIWDDTWNQTASNGNWKHEEPLRLDEEPDGETEREFDTATPPIFSARPKPPQPRLPMSEEEGQRAAERRATRERERNASRPFQRFIYMVSKECERIQAEAAGPGADAGADALAPLDINTQAYTNVKANWVTRGIWYRKWGILPGMNWKHEMPIDPDEFWIDGCAPPVDESGPVVSEEEEERPPIFGISLAKANGRGRGPDVADALPVTSEAPRRLSGSFATSTEGHSFPDAADTPQEALGPWAMYAGASPASPASAGPGGASQRRSSKGRSPRQESRAAAPAPLSLGRVRSGRVSKDGEKQKGPIRRSNRTREAETPGPRTRKDATVVQEQTGSRRSARLQALESKKVPPKRTLQPKPRARGETNTIAKPRGVDKRQRAARRKGRNDRLGVA